MAGMQDAQLPCEKCGTAVDIKIAQPRIMNMDSVSMLVIAHSTSVVCPQCNETLQIAVAGIGPLFFKMLPVAPDPQQSRIVRPPGLGGLG